MALGATLYRCALTIEDVDRGVYADVDLRLARHPSETEAFLVTRLLAFALAYEEGLAFSGGGLSDVDEPAIAHHDPTGKLLLAIEIGQPSPERLHRTSKRAERVMVFTHRDPASLVKEANRFGVHRAEAIELIAFPPSFLESIGATLERKSALSVLRTAGHLYVTCGDATFDQALVSMPLSGAT